MQERLMFGFRNKKPKEGEEAPRYYMLPGMGRSNRRNRNKIQMWSIIAGIVGSALIGVVLWLVNR
jgi:hypothetical protein